jgi:hypothetical protein
VFEKVKCQDPELAWIEVLHIWRATEDSVARAENALLKYYLRDIQTWRPQILKASLSA